MTTVDRNSADQHKEKHSSIADCLCVIGTTCLIVSLVIGYIVWSVYTIIGLTQVTDYKIMENCGSLLWRYNLTMIIMILVQAASSKPKENEDNDFLVQFSGLICSYFLSIGLASWGTYEVLGRSCSGSLTQYTIYTTGYIMVITQWSFIIILTLIGFTTSLCCCLMARKKKPPTPVPTNHLTYGTTGV